MRTVTVLVSFLMLAFASEQALSCGVRLDIACNIGREVTRGIDNSGAAAQKAIEDTVHTGRKAIDDARKTGDKAVDDTVNVASKALDDTAKTAKIPVFVGSLGSTAARAGR